MKRIKLLLLAILHSQRLVQLNFKHKSNSWILNKRNQDRNAEFYTVGVHCIAASTQVYMFHRSIQWSLYY